MSGAVEQRCADPLLKCSNATTERRLGYCPAFSRARETTFVQDSQEVFQPIAIHGTCSHQLTEAEVKRREANAGAVDVAEYEVQR